MCDCFFFLVKVQFRVVWAIKFLEMFFQNSVIVRRIIFAN